MTNPYLGATMKMPLADGATFAGYTILRLLGSGGMGEVYLAQHPRLPRLDAVKVLRADVSAGPDFRERFNREADLAAKLWHPHIVEIHDRGECDARLWISMDYVDGTDAGGMLRDQYPTGVPVRDVIEIVTAVAEALDYAHARGLLHRDVKPANILLAYLEDGERRILLSDFGVARDLSDTSDLTTTNMTVGTVAYAAPEQLMGLPLDGRADQYALAASAYHLLNGAPLFPHSNPTVVISQHLNTPPPALADRRPELAPLDPVLFKALAKDPEDRFACCAEFAQALGQSITPRGAADLNDLSTKMRVISPAPTTMRSADRDTRSDHSLESVAPQARRLRARRSQIFFAAAVLLVAIGVGGYFGVNAFVKSKPPFILTGTFQLNNASIRTSGLAPGYNCAGEQNYSDIGPNAPVTVTDGTGKLLAKGAIQSSYGEQGWCLLLFRVNDVPGGAKFYKVQVAQRVEMSYTEAEAKAGINISYGSSAPSPTATPPSAPPQPTPRPAPPTAQVPTPAPVPTDSESRSLAALQAYANADRPFVTAQLAERWVPQLSSKRPGLVADGISWNNATTLDEHLQLRRQYPGVRLLWSGDWSTFSAPDFWVTVAGITFPNADGALGWCTSQNLDRDHCYAKIVSKTHSVEGSTAFN